MAANIKHTMVIDASFILAYLLPDEGSEKVDEVFVQYASGKINLVSTVLLPFEVGNGLLAAMRKKRVSEEAAKKLFEAFERLAIELLPVDFSEVWLLATKKQLTIYDAGYSWLATSQHLPILSLDKALIS